MSVNRRPWLPEEQEEYDQMITEIISGTTNTAKRLDAFESRLADAIQAQRYWARDVERACLRKGMAAEIKNFQDRRNRALVSHEGRVMSMPKAQGRTVRTEAGEVAHDRALIEVWTWEQILDKRATDLRARRHYDDRIAYLDRLLALRELCPDSVSPTDAAAQLGIDLDEFLAKPLAA